MGAFALAERFARKGKGGRKARVGRVICLIALSTRHARSHYSTTRAAATTHVSQEEFEPTNRARESLSLLRPTVLLPRGSNTIHTIEDHYRNLYRSYAGKIQTTFVLARCDFIALFAYEESAGRTRQEHFC